MIGMLPKRRMLITGPCSESGGMMALTRDPSARRASSIGELSSMRRPTRAAMRWITCSRWSLVAEARSGQLQPAGALDVDHRGAVDQDVGHARVAHQVLDRAETEDLVHDLVEQLLALELRQRGALLPEQGFHPAQALRAQLRGRHALGLDQVERVHQALVHARLELLAEGRLPGRAVAQLLLLDGRAHRAAQSVLGAVFGASLWALLVPLLGALLGASAAARWAKRARSERTGERGATTESGCP